MKILSDRRCGIGEGPVWNEFDNKLYHVNGFGANEILVIDIYAKEVAVRKLEFGVSAMGFTRNGEMLISCKDGAFIFSDCGLEPNPDPDKLAFIAVSAAKSAKALIGIDPKVALLSFSTKGSAKHDDVAKVSAAVAKAHELAPEILIDGELQFDASIVPSVAKLKAPNSPVAGNANVLIFPDLDAGNIGYKIAERLGGFMAVGPICQGFAKPMNDLSRGCKAEDIVLAVAMTALQSTIEW